MSAALDGWAARRATHSILIATTATAVAGIWLSVWFADVSDTSMLSALPLLVLVVVAGAACGAEMTRDRRGELALTRLRGGHGLLLARQMVSEPLLSLMVGSLAGALAGIGLSAVARTHWLPANSATPLVTVTPALAAAATVAIILGVVATGMARALAKPLPEQTAARERPSATTSWALFGQTVVFAATAIGLYQAATNPESTAWALHAGPAALGLLGGLLAGWIVLSLGRVTLTTGRGSLSRSLAAGRLARTTDAGTPLLVLVAAAVVAVVSGGAAVAVDEWVDDSGRVNAGAPVVLSFEGDAADVLSMTENIDPDGRWLLAGVKVFEDDRPVSRRVFLDTTRYDRVVGGFLDTTPSAQASSAVAALRKQSESLPTAPVIGNGDWRVSGSIGDFTRTANIVIRVDYTTPEGRSNRTVNLSLKPGDSASARTPLNDCAEACTINTVSVAEGDPCTQTIEDRGECNRPTITLTELVAGDTDLLAQTWRLIPSEDGDEPGELQFDTTSNALKIRPARRGSSTIAPPLESVALPVLATSSTNLAAEMLVESPGGDTRPAEIVGEFDVLPVVSAGGTVADLQRALTGALPTVPDAQPFVLARADTPTSVLTALQQRGAGEPVTAASTGARIGAEANAAQVRVGLVVALAGLLVGALAMAAPLTRMRHDRAHDEAVLRLLGVPADVRSSANRLELAALAALAAFTVLVCGAIGVIGFLSQSRLLDVPLNQPPVDTSLRSFALAVVLVAAAATACVAVVVMGYLTRRTTASSTDPALLRDGVTG